MSAEPILECFNVLVQNKLYDVALGLGGHLLKACEKFIVDIELKKRFILKFLFVFDTAISSSAQATDMQADESHQQLDGKKTEIVIQQLVEALNKLVCLEFLKHCSQEETKVVFYSVWNLAFDAKERGMLQECRTMLQSLYEQVKRFASYCSEQRSELDKPLFDEEIIRTIIYRTLSLLADINVCSKNFTAARQAISDLERLQRNDADTYILKIRVLMNQSLDLCSSSLGPSGLGGSEQAANARVGDLNFQVHSRGTVNLQAAVSNPAKRGAAQTDKLQSEIMDSIY